MHSAYPPYRASIAAERMVSIFAMWAGTEARRYRLQQAFHNAAIDL